MPLKTLNSLLLALLICLAPTLTPSALAESARRLNREGLEAYQEKDYSKALSRFRKAGEKDSENLLLEYNIGAALAAGEKREDALGAFGKVSAARDPKLAGQASYSQGVVHYKQARKLADEKKIQEAVASAGAAVEANRKALRLDPDDNDARHNYEVSNRLKKILEKLQQEQQQQQQDQKNENKDKKEEQDKGEDQQKDNQRNNDENQDQSESQQDRDKQQEENQQQQDPEQKQDENQQDPKNQQDPRSQQEKDEENAILSVLNLLDDNDVEALKRMLKQRYGKVRKPEKDW